MWAEICWYLYYGWLHRVLKWILRWTTSTCELERICASHPAGAKRTGTVEFSLAHSRVVVLKKILASATVNAANAVNNIIILKSVDIIRNPGFRPTILQCLQQIIGYQRLVTQVTGLQKERYSRDSEDHEQQLMELWNLLKPGVVLERRKTKQWGDLGFQGEDPATDFRGMGILGLQNLLYFAENYNHAALKVLSDSYHPKFGYSFAVVGINLTSLVLDLLCKRDLRPHFYNSISGEPTLRDFHNIYCCVFCEFNQFWFAEEPETVMEFSRVLEMYRNTLLQRLKEPRVILTDKFFEEIRVHDMLPQSDAGKT